MFHSTVTIMQRRSTAALFASTPVCLAPTKKKIQNTNSNSFKSTPLHSTKTEGKTTTPASKIFAKSFFGSDKKSADWLDMMSDNHNNASASAKKNMASATTRGVPAAAATVTKKKKSQRGTVENPQRRPVGVRRPFRIHSDSDKDTYRKTLRRNMLALRDTNAAALESSKQMLKIIANKKTGKSTAANNHKTRVHSPFFTDSALRVRGKSVSVPAAPARISEKTSKKSKSLNNKKAKTTTTTFVDDHIHSNQRPLDGSDGMNPIAISQSFFTTYERKQFDRLKHATRSMRLRFNHTTGTLETVSQSDVRRRHQMYRFWDKLVLKVNNKEEN